MDVYQTDEYGVLVGVTTADVDPLDPTRFLIPRGAVETLPPEKEENEFLTWDGFSWAKEEYPIKEPEPEEAIDYAGQARSERNGLLSDSDWTQFNDVNVYNKSAWITYRQLLRDVPQQFDFPYDITWPTLEE